MHNRVETLRAICYTYDDLESIRNLGDSFSEKEIEFMVEFKKIYELGLSQLEKFINKLDEEGKDLDVYTILYYVNTLLNGPLGNYARSLAEGKKYFIKMPESMGILGNNTSTTQNIAIYNDMGQPLGCSVETFNKLPKFIQNTLEISIKETETIFKDSLYSSTIIDNTLPILDKQNNIKYDKEKTGEWVIEPSGTYINKDIFFRIATNNVSKKIFDKVKEYLGEENYRIYGEKKQYNAFDSEKNQSKSINTKIEKEYTDENGDIENITLDLMGDDFDSDDKRSRILKINKPEKNEEYSINTNEGQLGD